MKRLGSGEVRERFADTLNEVSFGRERVIIQRRGKDVAALVPVEDLELLERLEDRLDLDAAREALAETEREGTIAWDDLKRELGL